MNIDRSGSWKNRVITILKEVYYEAAWKGINAPMPTIPKFAKNYKKTDTLTTEELQQLFYVKYSNFDIKNINEPYLNLYEERYYEEYITACKDKINEVLKYLI